MKREFGAKLVREFLSLIDLTLIVDTSGAYIPGHGTPTTILVGRNRPPVSPTLRVVMGVRGEPATPVDAAQGLVWRAIVAQVDDPGSDGPFVTVEDLPRSSISQHPWNLGGGGATRVQRLIQNGCQPLGVLAKTLGILGMTNADDVMLESRHVMVRNRIEPAVRKPIVLGDGIRDWTTHSQGEVIFPYEADLLVRLEAFPGLRAWMWPYRTTLGNRATFSKKTYVAEGRPWWEWHQLAEERVPGPRIVFSFVATQNNFVFCPDTVITNLDSA